MHMLDRNGLAPGFCERLQIKRGGHTVGATPSHRYFIQKMLMLRPPRLLDRNSTLHRDFRNRRNRQSPNIVPIFSSNSTARKKFRNDWHHLVQPFHACQTALIDRVHGRTLFRPMIDGRVHQPVLVECLIVAAANQREVGFDFDQFEKGQIRKYIIKCSKEAFPKPRTARHRVRSIVSAFCVRVQNPFAVPVIRERAISGRLRIFNK